MRGHVRARRTGRGASRDDCDDSDCTERLELLDGSVMSDAPANTTIHVSTSAAAVERADRLAEELTRRASGVKVPRSAIYRRALDQGLDALEAEVRAGAVQRPPPGEAHAA